MSELMEMFHDLKAGKVTDAAGEVGKMFKTVRGYLSPAADAAAVSTATNKIEDVRDGVEALYRAYLVAKLGPVFGSLAAKYADTAVNGLVDGMESLMLGAASNPDQPAA